MQDSTKNIDSAPPRGIKNKPSIEDATTKAAIPSVNLVSFFGMLMMIISLVAGGLIGIVASIISFVCACNVMCRLVKMNFSKTNTPDQERKSPASDGFKFNNTNEQ
jgi:hypothetical protein